MAQEKPNPFTEWIKILRTRAPGARASLASWAEEVREEPAVLWHTPGVRYVAYTVGVILVLWVGSGLIGFLVPDGPANAQPMAETADFHVVCTNTACGKHWVIHRAFGFSRFPVECPECRQRTGMRAVKCFSPTCNGRWVAPMESDGWRGCPHCGQPLH